MYCTTPGVFMDRERQYWGVSFLTENVNTLELKPANSAGEFICAERCIVGFIDSFLRLVTTSTNSPLQFGWFRLKTEVSSGLFESKLENV